MRVRIIFVLIVSYLQFTFVFRTQAGNWGSCCCFVSWHHSRFVKNKTWSRCGTASKSVWTASFTGNQSVIFVTHFNFPLKAFHYLWYRFHQKHPKNKSMHWTKWLIMFWSRSLTPERIGRMKPLYVQLKLKLALFRTHKLWLQQLDWERVLNPSPMQPQLNLVSFDWSRLQWCGSWWHPIKTKVQAVLRLVQLQAKLQAPSKQPSKQPAKCIHITDNKTRPNTFISFWNGIQNSPD